MSESITITDAGPPPAPPAAPPQADPRYQPGQPPEAAGTEPRERDFTPLEETIRTNATRADEMIRALAEGRDPYAQPAGDGDLDLTPPGSVPTTGQNPPPPTIPPTNPDSAPTSESDLAERLRRAEAEASTWRGRHNAETKRLADEIAELRQQLDAASAKRAKDGLAEVLGEVKGATPEEVENYGEAMLDVAARYVMPRVREMVERAVMGLRAEITEQLQPVTGRVDHVAMTVEEQAKARFLSGLDEHCPTWRTLDTDAGFNGWLDQPDPMFGVARREGLDRATQNRDAARVAAFFNAYLNQRGGGAGAVPGGGTNRPASAGTGRPQGAPAPAGQDDGPPTLADLAAPGGGRRQSTAATDGGAGQPKVWTRQEISAFYAQVGRGDWAADPVRRDRVEREIARAQREGRVSG